MTQFARGLGLTAGAIWRWLTTHELMGEVEREGKYRYLSPALQERYLNETGRDNVTRVAEKPDGYIGLWEAHEIIAANHTVIWRAVRRGDVAAVRVGHANYYSEVDVRKLKESLDNTPPEGWVMVKAHAEARKADPSTVTRWLERNGYETAKHRAPDRQIAVYTPAANLAAWEQHYTAYTGRVLEAA